MFHWRLKLQTFEYNWFVKACDDALNAIFEAYEDKFVKQRKNSDEILAEKDEEIKQLKAVINNNRVTLKLSS